MPGSQSGKGSGSCGLATTGDRQAVELGKGVGREVGASRAEDRSSQV